MSDPKLKRTKVQIYYTASDGYRSEWQAKAGEGAEPIPAQQALFQGLVELARLAALFGFEAEAREAVDGAFSRVAEWRAQRGSKS